ncbi:MAG: type I glutamate--ammonia ligase [Planctomycetota bacterium]
MFESAREALDYIAQRDIDLVDLKVTGLRGQWLHITIPAARFTEKHFEEGVGYDGSSGSGFASVESGDVCALPIAERGFIDPFCERPTLSFLCRTVTADTRQPFANDPRTIAERAVAYMKQSGIADTAMMGPEFEFHIFDEVEVIEDSHNAGYRIGAAETDSELGGFPTIQKQQGYCRTPPTDQLHDLRSEIAMTLEELQVPVRYHHHEVGASGQCELEVQMADLVTAADNAMLIKYVVKNVARQYGRIATFMPKPIYGEAGNGMHVHQCLWKHGKPLFYDDNRSNYADLSDLALHYIAGLLTHGAPLTGLTNPSTNSFKRLVEGYEAPVNLVFSLANRSAAIRVPRYATRPEEKRIEYRPPDATANIYLMLASMLMAGLDGVNRKLDPTGAGFGPFDLDISKQDEAFKSRIAAIPRSLYDAVTALEADHEFLTQGEVFPPEFIAGWVEGKRREEIDDLATRPHPREFSLYLDV